MNKISFCSGWRFRRTDGQQWQKVTLPHDAMLHEPRSNANPSGKNGAWFAGGDYLYEKEFFVPAQAKEERIALEFEGVYHDAAVWVNGQQAAAHLYGYTGFTVDITGLLRYGENNVVRVFAKNSDQPNSRWYTGAGIYRPVWMLTYPQEHILPGGIRVRTEDFVARRIAAEVKTSAPGTVQIEILDGETIVAQAEVESDGCARARFLLKGGRLWSAEHPCLYTCRARFGKDEQSVCFGIRQISCDAKHGFCINGERVILRGACIHHDNGLLGACAFDFAEERKVRLLQRAGYNAIRSSHNPCSKALLEACDRLGMLVIDEYVDMWYIHKLKYDYAAHVMQEWKNDLADMVAKDYNHPSVIMYSLGNEVSETGQKRGIELCGEMVRFLHSADDRPVTCGVNIFFNLLSFLGFGIFTDEKAEQSDKVDPNRKPKAVGSEFFNNLASIYGATSMKVGACLPGCNMKTKDAFAKLDAAGYNYGILRYKGDCRRYPDRVIVGSETFCADARRFWRIARECPAVIGDFVWAGIDYLGEVGIGAWEYDDYARDFSGGAGWLTGGCGRLDITGREWAEVGYTRASFELDAVRIGVVRPDKAFEAHSSSAWRMSNALESWAWNGCEGRRTKVEVYSAHPRVELFVGGKSCGKKRTGKNGVARFVCVYEPGELKAVAYDAAGKTAGERRLYSAEDETVLTLHPELPAWREGELCYVRLQLTDARGVIKPLERAVIRVQAEGGELLGLGSAAPYNEAGYLHSETDTYYGEALAVIRPSGEGAVRVRAQCSYGQAEIFIPAAGEQAACKEAPAAEEQAVHMEEAPAEGKKAAEGKAVSAAGTASE